MQPTACELHRELEIGSMARQVLMTSDKPIEGGEGDEGLGIDKSRTTMGMRPASCSAGTRGA
jgi:hypothetical protein